MPKDVTPLLLESKRFYPIGNKYQKGRNLVVVKGKNAKMMLGKSRKLIAHGHKKQEKVLRMMRFGRENFARDVVRERNRGGMRAFKYRSGMRDLRNETEFRRVELRRPDRSRKRHRAGGMKPRHARWTGRGKKKYVVK